MKSYLSLIRISAKVRRRQNRMTLLCIISAVFLVTGIFSMADLFIRAETAKKYDIPELQSFVEGILKDSIAIKNRIIYPYNNSLAEGSMNKIKGIKRIMYGRNSFELLKAKVLFHERFHVEFN